MLPLTVERLDPDVRLILRVASNVTAPLPVSAMSEFGEMSKIVWPSTSRLPPLASVTAFVKVTFPGKPVPPLEAFAVRFLTRCPPPLLNPASEIFPLAFAPPVLVLMARSRFVASAPTVPPLSITSPAALLSPVSVSSVTLVFNTTSPVRLIAPPSVCSWPLRLIVSEISEIPPLPFVLKFVLKLSVSVPARPLTVNAVMVASGRTSITAPLTEDCKFEPTVVMTIVSAAAVPSIVSAPV